MIILTQARSVCLDGAGEVGGLASSFSYVALVFLIWKSKARDQC